MPKLNETEIDVWSDEVHSYYTYDLPPLETEFKPMIASVPGYSLRSGSSGSHMQQEDVDSMQEDSPMGNEGEPVPKKAKNPRPLPSGPSPERLLAHANALINRVSSFVTKLVNAKYGNKSMAITGENQTEMWKRLVHLLNLPYLWKQMTLQPMKNRLIP